MNHIPTIVFSLFKTSPYLHSDNQANRRERGLHRVTIPKQVFGVTGWNDRGPLLELVGDMYTLSD